MAEATQGLTAYTCTAECSRMKGQPLEKSTVLVLAMTPAAADTEARRVWRVEHWYGVIENMTVDPIGPVRGIAEKFSEEEIQSLAARMKTEMGELFPDTTDLIKRVTQIIRDYAATEHPDVKAHRIAERSALMNEHQELNNIVVWIRNRNMLTGADISQVAIALMERGAGKPLKPKWWERWMS